MAAVDALLAEARTGLVRVAPLEAAGEMHRGAFLVDIRPHAQRCAEGEVPGALVIERNVLEWRMDPTCPHHIPEIEGAGQRILVLCSEGYASSFAALSLRELGLDATDVIGGFQAWRRAGLPTMPGGTR